MIPNHVRGIIAVALSGGPLKGQHIPSGCFHARGEYIVEGLLVGFGFAFSIAVLFARLRIGVVDIISGFSYGALINPMSGNQRRALPVLGRAR